MADSSQHRPFHVVGIGASAGGIEALKPFFGALQPDGGQAFVVVTHLPPDRESYLVPILGQMTPIPVVAAEDGVEVEPNRVYVLPREGILTIADGRLRLRKPDPAHRERHPIDVFLTSLARACSEYAVGIILSGGGSDGTLGIKAIKEHGGLTLAQGRDHTEPRHASMPASAIATGLVDMVLPVQEMPSRLLAYIRGFEALDGKIAERKQEGGVADARAAICRILRNQVGHDFSGYKDKTFLRRVQRRMQVLQIGDLERYVERLRQDPDEPRLLFRDLLISVTNFLRDKEAFEELERRVIPSLLAGKGADDTVRVWVPGCATGEEAYSIAILVREGLDRLQGMPKVQIFATDIDEPALAVARTARYPAGLLEGISPERLKRFFTTDGSSCAVTKEIRDLCVFSAHSVIRDPPFSRIDLVSCRNLLIYLDSELQDKVIPIFHYALRPGGYLFLGTSENFTRHAHLFTPISKKHRIFRRQDHAGGLQGLFPLVTAPTQGRPGYDGAAALPDQRRPVLHAPRPGGLPLRQIAERRVLERFAPAYVVVDREGEVIHYSARTGTYLEAAEGAPNRQLLALARKGLRLELRIALREAVVTRRPVRRDGLTTDFDDRHQRLSISIEPLPERDGAELFLVVFRDSGPSTAREEIAVPAGEAVNRDEAVQHLESEARELRDRMQSTVEEYETALEELKSANEEMVSVNEELQSTNEELETSKEEQQSINEELNTANFDLKAKIEELDRANADLKNLFESTQIATVFLDRHLVIRSFTPAVTAIFNLIPTDRGRPLTDVANQLENVDLRADISRVLDTREAIERRVRGTGAASAHYLMRILPYRGTDNAVDGVLVTFVDVTQIVEGEQHQALLVAELNHRVRNMLGAVIGLVAQSAAREPDVRAFADRLLDRLHALARTYGMISRDNWTPVPLRELVEAELTPYADGDDRRITIEGSPVLLAPKAALAFGMALHELATNAARHGALGSADGRVSVAWSFNGAKGGQRLALHWREAGGPAVEEPRRSGFGTDMLRRLLTYELDGEAKIDFAREGVRAELSAPIDGELVRVPDRMVAAPGDAGAHG